jgi:hypothetical protein
MVALMKVYEEQGLEMPGKGGSAPRRKSQNPSGKQKSGCLGILMILVVCAFLIKNMI